MKDRITKKRADYTKLNGMFSKNKNKNRIQLTREQLVQITGGYISDNINYIKRKDAPLSKIAKENGYYIEKVEYITIYFKKMEGDSVCQ